MTRKTYDLPEFDQTKLSEKLKRQEAKKFAGFFIDPDVPEIVKQEKIEKLREHIRKYGIEDFVKIVEVTDDEGEFEYYEIQS